MKWFIVSAVLLQVAGSDIGEYMLCCPPSQEILTDGTRRCTNGLISLNCKNSVILKENFEVKDGNLYDSNGNLMTDVQENFCIGSIFGNNASTSAAIVCIMDGSDQQVLTSNQILLIVSVFFQLLTASIYLWLPQLRDLQGKCLTCLCFTTAVSYSMLTLLQAHWLSILWSNQIVCASFGYFFLYIMMSTFFWVNVVSINFTIVSIRPSIIKRFGENKTFSCEMLYAWGAPGVFLMCALIADNIEGNHHKPNIGDGSCWINGLTEMWIFFYGPVALIIFINLGLFVLSSFSLWYNNKSYEMSRLKNLKYKFGLYLRVLLIMGIPWIFEVASFVHGETHIFWTIMDTVNLLQGLLFFIVLVLCRKKAMIGLADKGLFGSYGRRLFPNNHDEEVEDVIQEDFGQTDIQLNG